MSLYEEEKETCLCLVNTILWWTALISVDTKRENPRLTDELDVVAMPVILALLIVKQENRKFELRLGSLLTQWDFASE